MTVKRNPFERRVLLYYRLPIFCIRVNKSIKKNVDTQKKFMDQSVKAIVEHVYRSTGGDSKTDVFQLFGIMDKRINNIYNTYRILNIRYYYIRS